MSNRNPNSKVLLLIENEEIYTSLKRATKYLGNIEVSKFTKDRRTVSKKVLLLFENDEDKLRNLFYGEIRSKYLNPIVVVGFKKKELFEKEYPLFYDHPYNHAYLKIPFDLLSLIDLLKKMTPISSQAASIV
jgi:hypothetical protein